MEVLLITYITVMFVLCIGNCQTIGTTLPTTEPAEEIEAEDTTTVVYPTTVQNTRSGIKITRKRETTTIDTDIETEETTTRKPLTTMDGSKRETTTIGLIRTTHVKNLTESNTIFKDIASSIFSYIKALRLSTFGTSNAQLSLKLNDVTSENLNSKPTHNDLQHSLTSGPAWDNLINSSEVMFNKNLKDNKVTIVPLTNQISSLGNNRPIFQTGTWSGQPSQRIKTTSVPENKQVTEVWPEKVDFRFNKKSNRTPPKFRLSNVLSMDNNSKFFSLQKDGNSKLAVFQYKSFKPKPPIRNVFSRHSFQFRG